MSAPEREYWRTTQWTLVQRAGQDGTPGTRSSRDQAWADLVERYRHPVERTVRYWLRGHSQAEEAVDDFFAYLLVQRVLPKADRERGRFRCFLQGVIRRYVQNWRRATRPVGRGTAEDEEEDAILAMASSADAADEVELAEERAWAEGLLEDALRRLCEDKPRDGALLVSSLGLDAGAAADRESLAASAGLTPNALRASPRRTTSTPSGRRSGHACARRTPSFSSTSVPSGTRLRRTPTDRGARGSRNLSRTSGSVQRVRTRRRCSVNSRGEGSSANGIATDCPTTFEGETSRPTCTVSLSVPFPRASAHSR
jgi:RNA polymerase sigma-70 factor (ECF subfamily)